MEKSGKQKKIKRYSGIQPQYFPRLHYFARILNTDIFVLRDDAQFVRKHKYPDGKTDKSYQAHSPIKQSFGRFLLSVPVTHEGFLSLSDTKVDKDNDWVESHLKTFKIAYSKAPYFKEIYPELEKIFENAADKSIGELNTSTIMWSILRLLGDKKVPLDNLSIDEVIDRLKKKKDVRLKEIKQASKSKSLKNKTLKTNEKIVALCKEFGANEDYCGGTGVSAYVDHSLFEKNGISIKVQDWKCKEYPQLFQKLGFIANLSILDLLFNVHASSARTLLLG
jgi:hypothetical protein